MRPTRRTRRVTEPTDPATAVDHRHPHPALASSRAIPLDPDLQARLDAARRAAAEHGDHGERRAPRPEKLQR